MSEWIPFLDPRTRNMGAKQTMTRVRKFNEFVRDHFIHVLTFTAVMGALFSAPSQKMKTIILFSIPHTPWNFDVPALAIFFMIFATSVHCRIKDFRLLSKTPRSFFLGLAFFYGVLPLLGWGGSVLGTLLLGPTVGPQIGAGIALVALMPVAAISALWVKVVKGNTPLLLVFLTLTTALNVVITPVLLPAILGVSKGSLPVPTELLVGNLLMSVIFPLAVGMLIREFFEKLVLRYQDIISLFGILGLQIAFFANAGSAIPILSKMSLQYLVTVVGLTVLLNILSSTIAFLITGRFKVPYEDRATISVAGGMRSNGIALVVGMKTFPALPLVAVPAAIYSFCQHIITGFVQKHLVKVLAKHESMAAIAQELEMVQAFETQLIEEEESQLFDRAQRTAD